MRILHINLAHCGLGRYGLLYGKALAACSQVEALSVFNERLLQSPLLQEQAYEFEHHRLKWSGSPAEKLACLQALRRIVLDFKPDVIHDTAGAYAKSILTWPILSRWAPIVVTEHDPTPHLGTGLTLGSRVAKWLLNGMVRHVFVHGPYCKQSLIQQGIPSSRISVIPHGHLGLFDRGRYTHITRNDCEVLFFGLLRYNKGVDMLPDIARRVHERIPNATFVVAGSSQGSNTSSSFAAARVCGALEQMKRERYFEVHDRFIPDEEVEYFFRRAGITLLPYREATQSGVLMIAMPLESIAVTTNVGDIPNVVRHGETGFTCKPDVESISNQLIELLKNPGVAQRVRQQASHFAATACSWEGLVEKALGTYRRLNPQRFSSVDVEDCVVV